MSQSKATAREHTAVVKLLAARDDADADADAQIIRGT
jgi:hypothetical protein